MHLINNMADMTFKTERKKNTLLCLDTVMGLVKATIFDNISIYFVLEILSFHLYLILSILRILKASEIT